MALCLRQGGREMNLKIEADVRIYLAKKSQEEACLTLEVRERSGGL